MIEISTQDELERAIWNSLIELALEQPQGWTLIGAQMVALYAFEAGEERARLSTDADVVVDTRVVPTATRDFSDLLLRAGFEFQPPSAQGVGHRFVRDGVTIDVLAPDGIGERADVTTVPPARTVRVPGATQALRRSEHVQVRLGRSTGAIPRPNLIGAILLKARAVAVDDVPQAQRNDLAFLLSLVDDPRGARRGLTRTEIGWLRAREELADVRHPAWEASAEGRREDALATFEILTA